MSNEKKFQSYIDAIQKNDLNLTKSLYCIEFLEKFDKNDFNGLLYACNLDHIEIARFLLDRNADIEKPCPYNEWRALHWAVGNGYDKVGELLLDRDADIESRTSKGMHPLHCAALADHVDAVRMLLGRGANIDARTNNNETALEMARGNDADKTVALFNKWIGYSKIFNLVRNDNIEAVRNAFLRERLLVTEQQTQLTVLDVAVASKAHACLEFIFLEHLDEQDILTGLTVTLNMMNLDKNRFQSQLRLYLSILFENKEAFEENATVPNINEAWILTGETWLELCSRFRRSIFVRRVMEMSLEIDQGWQRALDYASNHCVNIANQIRSRQAFLSNRIKAAYNRLHIAVQDNNAAVISHILDNELIDPDAGDAALGTPLCLALSLGHMESVLALREYGVNVSQTNQFQQTPFHIAQESKLNDNRLAFLQDLNDVDVQDCYGFTALHWAVINNNSEFCTRLIQRGADVLLPFKIPQTGHMDHYFLSAIIPLCAEENALTISLKLHRSIMNHMVRMINEEACNSLSPDGNSLLHLSVKLLVPLITKVLIDKGSDVNLANEKGNTPIISLFLESMENSCEMEGFVEIVELLVSHGADINRLNNEGKSAFNCALETNSRSTLNMILNDCRAVTVRPEDILILYQRQWADSLATVLDIQDFAFKKQLLKSYIHDSQDELFEFVLELSKEDFVESIVQEFLLFSAVLKRKSIFDILLKYPIREPALFTNGDTLLTSMITSCDEDYCLALVKSDGGEILVDIKNQGKKTALHVAADRAFLKLFKTLMIMCQNVNELCEELTPGQQLMIMVSNSNDNKKISKLETIVKTMIKLRMDGDQFAKLILKCNNAPLKDRLEKYYKKMNTGDEDEKTSNLCDICLDNKKDCQMGCGHPMCRNCASKVPMCPTCRQPKGVLIPLYL